MHYRQTIIDTAVTALEGVLALASVTSKDFFPDQSFPAARVYMSDENLPDAQREMNSQEEHRVMQLTIQVINKGNDVMRTMNDVLDGVEGVMGTALDGVSDCSWLEAVRPSDVVTEQDQETMSVELEYAVFYSTVLGDPATRA